MQLRGSLRLPFTSSRLAMEPFQGVSWLSVICGRILLSIAFLLLALMPITEHLWTFDRFLLGGPDLELGLFALISILCLVVVISRHRRQGLAVLLAVHQFFVNTLPGKLWPLIARTCKRRTTVADTPHSSNICLTLGVFPLQV
jgi:hypothetical protein